MSEAQKRPLRPVSIVRPRFAIAACAAAADAAVWATKFAQDRWADISILPQLPGYEHHAGRLAVGIGIGILLSHAVTPHTKQEAYLSSVRGAAAAVAGTLAALATGIIELRTGLSLREAPSAALDAALVIGSSATTAATVLGWGNTSLSPVFAGQETAPTAVALPPPQILYKHRKLNPLL